MLKSIWSLLLVTVGVGILFCDINVHAQAVTSGHKTEHKIKSNKSPFDFVQNIVENGGQLQQDRVALSAPTSVVRPKVGGALKYNKKYSGSPKKAQAIYDSLVEQYGPPKSVRGKSHVWDIENPEKNLTQADIVTVILKMEKSGAYVLTMDRDRGENGRATWDATHTKIAKKKRVKRKKLKPQRILQLDND